MNETYVTMCGYVATDPQTRLTRAQVPFVSFRLASTPRRVDHATGEYVDAGTSFVTVTAFRSLGANVAESVGKGQPVVVYGRMRVNQWTGADGRTGTSVEVEAFSVGFDMARGRSTFERVRPPQVADGDPTAVGRPAEAGLTEGPLPQARPDGRDEGADDGAGDGAGDGVDVQPRRELVSVGDASGGPAGR